MGLKESNQTNKQTLLISVHLKKRHIKVAKLLFLSNFDVIIVICKIDSNIPAPVLLN